MTKPGDRSASVQRSSATQAGVLGRLLHDGFVSGQELSQQLGISRTAIWKQIEQLRGLGYAIEAIPRQGYRLIARPDRVQGEAISLLRQMPWGSGEIVRLDEVDSTNRVAKQLAVQGVPEGTLVVAERQTGGRGRLGREWSSPAGGLWISLILRPALAPNQAARITLLAAVAVSAAVKAATGLTVGIKWPNDLLSGGRKLCGILTEMSADMDQIAWVVVGIGLNANLRLSELPSELALSATTLQNELGQPTDRNALIAQILDQIGTGYQRLSEGQWGDVLAQWRRSNVTLGNPVQVTTPLERIEGQAIEIDDDGTLLVATDQGVRRIVAGDVTLRR